MTSQDTMPAPLVARPRLAAQLDEGLRRGSRLLLVVAPAGYGKTTLLHEWLAGRGPAGPHLWHTLGEADNDPPHLLAGLLAALRAALPAPLLPAVDAQSPLAYALALLFRQAAAAAGADWLLLLDDYHWITNPAVHQTLDTLLGQPDWPARLVLTSRGLPPLGAIARLRVEGRLQELDETDLRFTAAETSHLLAGSGLALEEEALRQVAARTEGWPVALQLLRQAAQRQADPDLAALLGRIGDERPLFDYLAGQVLGRQPAELQAFLRRTALLPYLNAELCNALLERADASAVLDGLERDHLFIAPLTDRPGRAYRYHALFQDLLQRSLEQVEGAAAVVGWHRRAAAVLLANRAGPPGPQRADDHAAAIEHLLAAGDWPAAAQEIETLAATLDFGALPRMEPWFARLPAEVVAGRPRLLLAWGRLRERQGRWAEASDLLARAERACPGGPSAERAAALRWQAWVFFRQERHAEAIALCHRALADLPGDSPDLVGAEPDAAGFRADAAQLQELAGIYNVLANCHGNQGDPEAAQRYYVASLQLYHRLGNREREALALHNLAAGSYLTRGRLREAIATERTSLRMLDDLHSYRVCFPLITLTQAHLLCGELETARAVVERLLRLTDAYQDVPRRGYALYLRGHLYREQGEHAAARRCYEEADVIARQFQDRFVLFELHQGRARLALAAGDLREARRQSLAAREIAQSPPDHQLEGQALATLGLILERGGDVRQAEDTYRQALARVTSTQGCLDQAAIQLYLADLCRQEGRDEEAQSYLQQSLALSGEYGYDFLFTARERGRALPLLVAALARPAAPLDAAEVDRLLRLSGADAVEPLAALLESAPAAAQERAARLLGEIGDERAVPALSALRRQPRLAESVRTALAAIAAAPRPPLRVRALGGFAVSRGPVPLPPSAWQRRKTRLLLLFLLSRRRPVACDEVLEALWPDLSPEAAGQALNTTFSDLRRILEPHLPKGMASRYLERDEETLAFRRDSAYWYDAAAFEQALRAGETAHEALELYRGDFLPEEPYVDWVLRERERLRGLYLNALVAAMEEQVRAGDWRAGAELARRILDQEPWLEEVWRALLTCYDRLGRRGEALQAYQECVRVLRAELDAAPAPETQALYEQIRGGAAAS